MSCLLEVKDADDSDNKKSQRIPDNHYNEDNKDGELGWRSFIQGLAANTSSHESPQITVAEETEQVYVHPLAKRSSSILGTKSLEMCTESLGSETGSNVDHIIDDSSNHSMEKQGTLEFQRSSTSRVSKKKMDRNVRCFPPPLTSISGSESVRVRSHRECGRLVLRAVSSLNSFFQAERADGCLRLYSLLRDGFMDCDEEVENSEADDESYHSGEEDGGKFDCEVEMEEFSRPSSSCKEAGPRKMGIPGWGPVWVAISY